MSRGIVLLVAEDDPSDLFFLLEAFREACPGIELREVEDGERVIDYLSGRGRFADRAAFPLPTHVLLDVKMPRRSGLEVLKWIRSRPEFRDLPVTVLSGSELGSDMEEARGLGAEYLVKPIEYVALLELVRSYCRRFSGTERRPPP